MENNPEIILKKPKDGTMEWLSFKESTTHNFIEKIKSGVKIPITDERMTRFIISSNEAVELIFKALKMGGGRRDFCS